MKTATQNSAAPYSADQWITGAPIAVDASPNVTPPAASRIILVPSTVNAFSETPGGGSRTSLTMWAFIVDGTTMDMRAWWYDEVQTLWVPQMFLVSLNYGTENNSNTLANIRHAPGQKHFAQVLTNPGNATKVAVVFR